MQKLCIFWACVLSGFHAVAQGFQIKAEIKGLGSNVAYLGFYEGGKAYSLDTLLAGGGSDQFSASYVSLSPGIYFLTTNKGKMFDFVVSKPTDTIIIGLDLARPDSAWSINSPENEAFFRFETYRKKLESAIDQHKNMRNMMAKATEGDTSVVNPVDRKISALYIQTDSLALDFVKRRPNDLFSAMLRSVRPPEPPASIKPLNKNGQPNPAYQVWQKKHFWDNTDFSNETLLKNVFWQVFFDNYFARYVKPLPDSIINSVDEILRETPKNGAFYRFIVLRITQYYEMNEFAGADRIFVHMVDRFLKKDETPWLDQATLERLDYKASVHRPNLTGSLATNFTMKDETGKQIELYEIDAPVTVLIFYSPLCQHCMEVMPKIYQTWLDYAAKSVAALAINTDKQEAYWKKFVAQQHWNWHDLSDENQIEQLDKQFGIYSLPVIYVLDRQKRILYKRVKPNELGNLLSKVL
ncbi:MAG: redoxin domain-containing protein [Saprospiraceae bacterium]|nr:redoxin domain-containing protein [Saprospiraceae bacterium]